MRITITIVLLAALGCSSSSVPPPAAPRERFDDQVRQDFFDGLRGDTAALDRAMALCEQTLAAHPDHAEAMVWHGAGLTARALPKFHAGDVQAGVALYRQGVAEMARAVALAPDDVGVRIPRGAVLLTSAPFTPEPQRSRLLALGVGDYEATLAKQEPVFSTLTLHAREQLLYGLTDAYASLGQLDRARATYARMQRDAAGSALLARAAMRADGKPVDGPAPCEQCHAR